MSTLHYGTKVVMFTGRRYGNPVPVTKTACGQKGRSTTSRVAFVTATVPCEECRKKLRERIL